MAIRYYPEIRRLYERLAAKRRKAARLVARSIIAHKLAQAAFHVMKHHVEYKEELLFRFSKDYAARQGGEALRIGGRFRWSLARLGAVFPAEKE